MKTDILLKSTLVPALLFILQAAAYGSALDVSTIISEVSRHRQDTVMFTEEKHFSFLDQPLFTKGILHYQPPDGLIREVIEPEKSKIIIAGNQLTVVNDAGKKRSLNISDQPQAKLFVDTFLATILGRTETIHKLFRGSVEGSTKRWTIHLIPRDDALAALIDKVILRGRDSRIESIETREVGGDYSLMRLSYDAP
jgi:outer membrane lipoprotein-sorting protein